MLLGLGQATAAPLDPANISGTVFFNVPPPARLDVNTFGTFPQTGPGGFLQFTASGFPGPFLSGEAHISKDFTGRVSGILIYAIEILGPAGNVSVLVDVSGGASASSVANDLFAGFAMKSLWSLEDATLGLQTVFSEGIDTGQLSGIFNQNFGHTVTLMLTANHVYRVTMVADAFAAAGSSGTSAFATAFIDPIFSFGAGVGPEYSFLLSEGVGNSTSASVPEPHPFALLIAGMIALGLCRLRETRGLSVGVRMCLHFLTPSIKHGYGDLPVFHVAKSCLDESMSNRGCDDDVSRHRQTILAGPGSELTSLSRCSVRSAASTIAPRPYEPSSAQVSRQSGVRLKICGL